MRRVLVVDDDPMTARMVTMCLEGEGCEIHHLANGTEAASAVESLEPDLVILDVKLPGLDGLSVCREIRRRHDLPILMLSGLGDDIDRIVGLEVGADDYLTKPFNPRELVARVRAIFRRWERWRREQGDVLTCGPLRVDLAAHRVEVRGLELHLTPLEFSILRVLVVEVGRVVTRQVLLDRAWGRDFVGDERTVDVHIRKLRAKLREAAPGADLITAVRGVGYRLEG